MRAGRKPLKHPGAALEVITPARTCRRAVCSSGSHPTPQNSPIWGAGAAVVQGGFHDATGLVSRGLPVRFTPLRVPRTATKVASPFGPDAQGKRPSVKDNLPSPLSVKSPVRMAWTIDSSQMSGRNHHPGPPRQRRVLLPVVMGVIGRTATAAVHPCRPAEGVRDVHISSVDGSMPGSPSLSRRSSPQRIVRQRPLPDLRTSRPIYSWDG
jgi:hypothetical protein